MIPTSDAYLEDLADELVEWAYTTNSLCISKFFDERKISLASVFTWKERHEIFRDAYALAKQILGTKREEGAIRNKLNYNIFRASQFMYQPELWEPIDKHQADLKTQSDTTQTGPITVIVKDDDGTNTP